MLEGKKSLLPQELEIQILLGLPTKSLLRLKSISKSWYSLIGSTSFTARYSQISNARDRNEILCFRKDPTDKMHLISILDTHSSEKIVDLEWPLFLDEGIENKKDFDRRISMLGPVNGIYCVFNSLVERWIGSLVLWNPAIKEYKHIFPTIALPMPPKLIAGKRNPHTQDFFNWRRPIGLSIGFGFDDNINDYKVVIIFHWIINYGPENDRWHVRVYNLSTDSWRTIHYLTLYSDVLPPFQGIYRHFPCINTYPNYPHCLLNGVFHWSCDEGIVAFDLADETFQLFNGPSLAQHYNCKSVWVLRDSLAMILWALNIDEYPSNSVELWMMMNYGLDDSWAILHTFGHIDWFCPVGIPTDHHIFFCDGKGQLISSWFEDCKIKEYGIHGAPVIYENLAGIHINIGVVKYVKTLEILKSIYH